MTPLEKHGAWVLRETLEPPKPKTNARCYFVRIVYRSIGDELLAVEVGPLACLTAEALLGKHRRVEVFVGKSMGTRGYRNSYVAKSATGAEGAYMIHRDRWGVEKLKGDFELTGARVVTLPSQIIDGVVRVDDEAI